MALFEESTSVHEADVGGEDLSVCTTPNHNKIIYFRNLNSLITFDIITK